jgi:hypothetical protein
MVKQVDKSELRESKRAELEAAFGPDADIVELEVDDLEEVDEPHPTERVDFDKVEEGDTVEVRFPSGKEYEGIVTSASEYTWVTEPTAEDDLTKVMSYTSFIKDETGRTTEMLNLTKNGSKGE